MATKTTAAQETATAEQDVETTLLDVQSAAVKRLLTRGKERGYITFDELNAVLPPEQNSSEQIEDVMANLNGDGHPGRRERGDGGRRGRAREGREDRGGRRGRAGRGRGRQRRRSEPWAHRRPGPHVPARDGIGRAAVARGRDRHCQAHRGRAGHDDRWAVRKPADVQGDHHLARPAQGRAGCCCATSSTSKPRRAPARRRRTPPRSGRTGWRSAPRRNRRSRTTTTRTGRTKAPACRSRRSRRS